MNGDELDKVKRKGTFTQDSARAAGKASAAKRKGRTGIHGEVRKHKKLIVDGLVAMAKSGTDTARTRALIELARLGWGSVPTAAEMGTLSRADADDVTGDRSKEAAMSILNRLAGGHGGVVVLPGEDGDGDTNALRRVLARMNGDQDLSLLTDAELRELDRLRRKARGEAEPPASYTAPPRAQDDDGDEDDDEEKAEDAPTESTPPESAETPSETPSAAAPMVNPDTGQVIAPPDLSWAEGLDGPGVSMADLYLRKTLAG